MNRKIYLLLLACCCLLSTCVSSKGKRANNNGCKITITQGLAGKVIWREGNHRPTKEGKTGIEKGIQRQLYVYELTKPNQIDKEGKFYNTPKTKLIRKLKSDAKGCFQAELPEGAYSIFVEENIGGKTLFYANSFDTEMNINKFSIEQGKITEITLIIDYQAKY